MRIRMYNSAHYRVDIFAKFLVWLVFEPPIFDAILPKNYISTRTSIFLQLSIYSKPIICFIFATLQIILFGRALNYSGSFLWIWLLWCFIFFCAVEVYTCKLKGLNCGQCLLLDKAYGCVWCKDVCSLDSHCDYPSHLRDDAICPDPRIASVSCFPRASTLAIMMMSQEH